MVYAGQTAGVPWAEPFLSGTGRGAERLSGGAGLSGPGVSLKATAPKNNQNKTKNPNKDSLRRIA